MSWRFIDKHFTIFREFLEKNNFTIKEKLFSPKVFGDAYVILESSNTEIRLTKDRSMISVEMRGKFKENGTWYTLDTVLEFVDFIDHTKYDDYWESALAKLIINWFRKEICGDSEHFKLPRASRAIGVISRKKEQTA